MARPLRIEFEGALYHVTSRGDRREAIYEDDDDRQQFLALLGQVVEQMNWLCYAYCLMTNHYHLVIEKPEGNLAKGMRQLNGVYTQVSNRRHQRVGHLFQGRYQAIIVDKDAYLLELTRYVVLNPVRAVVAEPGQWRWSSYNAMIGAQSSPAWLATAGLLAHFGENRAEAQACYVQFVAEGMGEPVLWEQVQRQIFLGDEHFVTRLQTQLGTQREDINIPRVQRRPPPPSLSVIATHYPTMKEAMVAAYATGEYSYQDIAAYFGVHFTTVGRLVREARQREERETRTVTTNNRLLQY